jgi:hypothetical protein
MKHETLDEDAYVGVDQGGKQRHLFDEISQMDLDVDSLIYCKA